MWTWVFGLHPALPCRETLHMVEVDHETCGKKSMHADFTYSKPEYPVAKF